MSIMLSKPEMFALAGKDFTIENWKTTNEYSSWSSVDAESNWSCELMPFPAACRLLELHALSKTSMQQ